MGFRCVHCSHRLNTGIQDKVLIYCPLRKMYPSPNFIKAWGCDQYEDEQLKLFKEEEDGN